MAHGARPWLGSETQRGGGEGVGREEGSRAHAGGRRFLAKIRVEMSDVPGVQTEAAAAAAAATSAGAAAGATATYHSDNGCYR
jgi:hypothetical protein